MNLIYIFIGSIYILSPSFIDASVCVISFWTEWGNCIGNCNFALRTRNRDVIRPPFPERMRDGRLALRPCPTLYQVQSCTPAACQPPSDRSLHKAAIGQRNAGKIKRPPPPPPPAPPAPVRPLTITEQQQQHDGRSTTNNLVNFRGKFGRERERKTLPCGHGADKENTRCCRSTRDSCPIGVEPQFVTRWHRSVNDTECVPYMYTYCGVDVEMLDAPIRFEQNCYDLCYSEEEKLKMNAMATSEGSSYLDGFVDVQ